MFINDCGLLNCVTCKTKLHNYTLMGRIVIMNRTGHDTKRRFKPILNLIDVFVHRTFINVYGVEPIQIFWLNYKRTALLQGRVFGQNESERVIAHFITCPYTGLVGAGDTIWSKAYCTAFTVYCKISISPIVKAQNLVQ